MRVQIFPKKLPADVDAAINAHIIKPFKPSISPIPRSARIACIGSCFAQEIAKSLGRNGQAALGLFVSERLNTSFSLAHMVANAFDGTPFPDGFVPGGLGVIKGHEVIRDADAS